VSKSALHGTGSSELCRKRVLIKKDLIVLTVTYVGNTVGIAPEGQISFYAKGGTNIQISTGGYVTNGTTSMPMPYMSSWSGYSSHILHLIHPKASVEERLICGNQQPILGCFFTVARLCEIRIAAKSACVAGWKHEERIVLFCTLYCLPCGLRGGHSNPTNLLAIGNSITFHGPNPSLGWYGNWGMAAPTAGQDYVHLVAKSLSLPFVVANSTVERGVLGTVPRADSKTIGDNAVSFSIPAFGQAYNQLAAAMASGHSLVCVSTWWQNPEIDALIQAACAAHGGCYAYIGDLRTDPANTDLQTVQYSNWQVNDHPRQWGHQHIAERVLLQLQGQ
jgi:hypothetical protein